MTRIVDIEIFNNSGSLIHTALDVVLLSKDMAMRSRSEANSIHNAGVRAAWPLSNPLSNQLRYAPLNNHCLRFRGPASASIITQLPSLHVAACFQKHQFKGIYRLGSEATIERALRRVKCLSPWAVVPSCMQ